MQYRPNPPGRPLELTEALIEHIVSFVPHNFIPNQVARVAKVPQRTLCRWLTNGKEDFEIGVDSLYAQLWLKFEEKKGNAVQKLLGMIISEGKWQGIWEIVQSIDRENFGKDSELIKEILSNVNVLVGKGVTNNGRGFE